MLQPNQSQAKPQPSPNSTEGSNFQTAYLSTLHLLLFVDERSGSKERTRAIRSYLQELHDESLKENTPFVLEVLDVRERPDLVEYFRLVATPSLVKIYPEPRQTLAGSDLVAQLKKWWSQWKRDRQNAPPNASEVDREVRNRVAPLGKSNGYYPENIGLREEIFRLQKDKEELIEQLEFKDRVLAMLAHDLRTPLTAASIAVETLELAQNQPNTEKAASLSAQLYKQARTQFRIMNRMIGDILQAAKIKSGEFTPKLQSVNLAQFCEEILQQFGDRFQGKNLQIERDLPQDVPEVYADPELIGQVLTNLLDNAIKYTPAGGSITVSLLHRTTQKVQLSVCDTGPGIPEEKRDLIFEGHFRLKRDESKEGFGIGLALCQQVIRAHYGQIWVDSDGDRGSCFHFTLPVHR